MKIKECVKNVNIYTVSCRRYFVLEFVRLVLVFLFMESILMVLLVFVFYVMMAWVDIGYWLFYN